MKKYFLPFYSCMLAALIVGCTNSSNVQSNDNKETVEIVHRLGKTPVVKQPTRIVALDIGAVETLHALGVKMVGVPKKFVPDYLADLVNDPNIADVGSVIEPNFEAINALNPEVILMSTRQERFYEELSDIAPSIFVGIDNTDYINSFHQVTGHLASIVGKEAEAKAKMQVLDTKIAAAQERFKDDPNKALFLMYNNGRFSAFGPGSRFAFLFDVLGIKPALEKTEDSVHGQRVSNEFIAETNPDYLFIVDRNAAVLGKVANKTEVENKLIQQTKAYKNGKVFYLDPNTWYISAGSLTSVEMMIKDIEQLFD